MPKVKLSAPLEIPYTDEKLGIPSEMIDEDNEYGVESRFYSQASIEEGCSGRKSIDTLFENTSQDTVEAPRSARNDVPLRGKMPNHEGVGNPAPVDVGEFDYPHRRY